MGALLALVLTACGTSSPVEDSARSNAADTDQEPPKTSYKDDVIALSKTRASDYFAGKQMTIVTATLPFASDGTLEAWVHLDSGNFGVDVNDERWDKIYCRFSATIDNGTQFGDKLVLGDGYRLGALENVTVEAWDAALGMNAAPRASISAITFDSTMTHTVSTNDEGPQEIRAHCKVGELPAMHPTTWFDDYPIQLVDAQ